VNRRWESIAGLTGCQRQRPSVAVTRGLEIRCGNSGRGEEFSPGEAEGSWLRRWAQDIRASKA
jgi:hypothetical protein